MWDCPTIVFFAKKKTHMRQNKYEYDAFISHAVEDKIPIANELCAKLERAGLKIWYSGKELGVGDSIEKTIERGLNRSRYGIVIFSPTYLAKNWTIREFYTLLAKEIEEQKVILPVLYNITLDELKNKDLVMADRFAVNSEKGIDFVVDRLVNEINKKQVVKKKEAWFSRIWMVLVLSLLVNVSFILKGTLFASAGNSEPSFFSKDVIDSQRVPDRHPTLLGEMQGLLTRMNGCNCSEHPVQPARYQSAFVVNNGQQERAPDYPEQGPNPDETTIRRAGNKVTMAVVFQIETPDQAQSSPPFARQMNDLIQTIDDNENHGPFVTVTNRRPSLEYSGQECDHGTHAAD